MQYDITYMWNVNMAQIETDSQTCVCQGGEREAQIAHLGLEDANYYIQNR